MLGMQNDATLQAGHEGYDNLQAVNPAQSYQLALALSENKKRPGILEKQGMLNQARKMFLPRNPEEQEAAQWAALERGDMGFGGPGVGAKHTEGDLMRAFNLISGKTTGAGDSFTMADKQGLRDATPKYTLTDTEKANQVKSVTDMLLGKNTAEITAIQDESTEKQNLLKAQALGVASTTSATASKTGAQQTAIEGESAETVNLLKQKVVKEQAATWVQRATERAIRTNTRNKDAESGKKLLLLQAQTGVFGQQANAIVAAIANKNYESALRGMKTAVEASVTWKLGGQNIEKIKQQMEVLKQEVLNLQAEKGNKNSESTARTSLTQGKGELVEAQTDLVKDQQTATQVKTYDDSTLTKAKTDLVGAKEQGELTDIAATMTGTGTGTGKNQRDFRKTEAFQRVGRKVADEGVAYTGTKQADEWGWQDDLEEFTTHVWPDDDKKLRGLMLPFPTDKAEQAKRMEAGKLFLRKAGDYDKDSQRIILKSILQVK